MVTQTIVGITSNAYHLLHIYILLFLMSLRPQTDIYSLQLSNVRKLCVFSSADEAEVMWSFCLSFCKQDNWRTWKRTSTKLGRHGQGGDPLEVMNFWWWSGSACGFWITWIFFTIAEYRIRRRQAKINMLARLPACVGTYARFGGAVACSPQHCVMKYGNIYGSV